MLSSTELFNERDFFSTLLAVRPLSRTQPFSTLMCSHFSLIRYCVSSLLVSCSPFQLRFWNNFMEPNLNIVTFALFCLPKSIFSNTILRLVISTWLNNHGWTTLELKPCHCIIWKLAIYLIFLQFMGPKENETSGLTVQHYLLFGILSRHSASCSHFCLV